MFEISKVDFIISRLFKGDVSSAEAEPRNGAPLYSPAPYLSPMHLKCDYIGLVCLPRDKTGCTSHVCFILFHGSELTL